MHITPSSSDAERVLREVARLLAPYVAEELNRPRPATTGAYDAETCRIMLEPLSTPVLERALVLFDALQERGKIASVELAALLDTTPRAIGGLVTSQLKRRAKALGLPLPFDGGEGALAYGGIPKPAKSDDPGRTYWQDRDGIAARMATALREAINARPDARHKRFVWEEGDVEVLSREQVGRLIGQEELDAILNEAKKEGRS